MEKLNKVIAGLECCDEANDTVNICPMRCPYYDERDGEKVCLDILMDDALELLKTQNTRIKELKDSRLAVVALNRPLEEKLQQVEAERDDLRKDIEVLSEDLTGAHEEIHKLAKSLSVARAERDAAREKLARITGEREAAWLSGSQTNYQKIKNMGPLHLTEWILKTVHPCECCDKQGVCGIPEDEVNDEYCAEHILLWLMQEVTDA